MSWTEIAGKTKGMDYKQPETEEYMPQARIEVLEKASGSSNK